MAISVNDIRKLELAMQSGDPRQLCPQRYQSGASYAGVYRILELWPDRLKEVETTDGEWRENAVTYLEADPCYFRSGYDKAQLLRRLKRADLSAKHKQRLVVVLMDVVGRPSGVEFRQYCQLAPRLASKELTSALTKLVKSADDDVRRRASWMLEHVEAA